jgi:HAD superfamily hydrolase (TIGR01549 family)
MPKVFIFDFDDTLAHLWIDWHISVKREVLDFGIKEGLEPDPQKHIALIANEVSDTPGRKKKVDRIFRKYELECFRDSAYYVYAPVNEMLKELRRRGHKTAVASNNMLKTLQEISEVAGFELDAIRGRDTVKKAKPHPDMVFSIMDELKVGREDVIFVGDSFWDEEAGKNAEVRTLIFRPGTVSLRKVLGI